MIISENPLQSWLPYKINYTDNNQILCNWLNTFNKPFTEPFFDETLVECKALFRQNTVNVSNIACSSNLILLEDWAQHLNYVNPTAFIFHISRCGSTLVSQLLGMDKQNIVLAEVPFFDELLRLPYKMDGSDKIKTNLLLKAAIKFYGQKRTGNEKHLFIKTDSWHIFFYEQLRKLYPDTPFILLYRSPGEVYNSHIKQRGMQAVPGLIEPQLFGLDVKQVEKMTQDVYLSKVLERYLTRYLEIANKDKLSLLLNYNEGIMPIIEKIAIFSNITITDANRLEMQHRSSFHSKRPNQIFSEVNTTTIPYHLQTAFNLYDLVEKRRIAML